MDERGLYHLSSRTVVFPTGSNELLLREWSSNCSVSEMERNSAGDSAIEIAERKGRRFGSSSVQYPTRPNLPSFYNPSAPTKRLERAILWRAIFKLAASRRERYYKVAIRHDFMFEWQKNILFMPREHKIQIFELTCIFFLLYGQQNTQSRGWKAGFNTNTGYQQKQNLPVPILQKGLHVTPSVRPKYIWINENSVANPDLNHRILLFLASFNYEPLKSVQHKHRK